METKNTFRNAARYAAGLLVSTVILTLAACGNKGGNNNTQPPVVVGGYGTCPTCLPAGGNVIFTGESVDSYGVIRFNWNFTSTTGVVQPQVAQPGYPYGYNGGYGYNSGYGYSGGYGYNGGYIGQAGLTTQVGVQGAMNITQSLNLGYCQLPAGSYSLGTVQVGTWQNQMVSNIRMQGIGPASVNMILTQGQVTSNGYLQPGQISSSSATTGRIFGNVMIESVNGYPCQMSILVQ